MPERKAYAYRSSAVHAARQHCRKLLGPAYEAKEGPDYEIHPLSEPAAMRSFPKTWFMGYRGPSFYKLRGPAKEKMEG